MIIKTFLSIFLIVGCFGADPKCTVIESDPCVCLSTGSSTTCDGVSTGSKLKQLFSEKSASTVDSVTITHSSDLTSLPTGVFGPVKTKHVFIAKTGLSSIDDNAFQGSENLLETIIFNENNFPTFNFKSIKNMKKLDGFRITNDKLTKIPEDAFPDFPFMSVVDLANNSINTIEKKAFHNLQSIALIDLKQNKLTTIGEDVFNLADSKDRVTIDLNSNEISSIDKNAFKDLKIKNLDLENNKLETLSQTTFEPILDYLNSLGSEPGVVHVKGNPFKCTMSIKWLVNKSTSYKRRVANFKCNGKRLSQLTESDLSA